MVALRSLGLIVAIAPVVVADVRCLPCHPNQVASFAKTGMGRSITAPSSEAVTRQQFRHEASGTTLEAEWRDSLVHRITRKGLTATYRAAWAVGSGNQGKSYLIALGDALFQSPISWYSARRTWDLSPGYQEGRAPDFDRPVTADCLFCHAGSARPRPGTLNRFEDPPFEPAAIDCDRCHGDPDTHLRSRKRGDIVNPSRLEPDRRDAVCEQCHLSGVARIPNAGKSFADYRPGMRLEDVFSVYVEPDGPKGLKVVSQSEQMVRSRCYLESGRKLWCGTCHDPHRAPAEKAAWYRDRCLGCHQSTEMVVHRNRKGADCAGCHMPQVRPYDGGHTAFHDHWIRIGEASSQVQARGLRAWRPPAVGTRDRNLGLAYISTGDLGKGLSLLTPDAIDGALETGRGAALLAAGKASEAAVAFRNALAEQPKDSTRHLNLAAALLALGNHKDAKEVAEKAIELEPLLEDAYALLAEIEPQRARYWKGLYQRLAPQRILP